MRVTLCVFIVPTSQPKDASKIQIWFRLFTSRFLQHFALSSVSQEPILEQHLGALFPSADATQPATSFQRNQVRKTCTLSSSSCPFALDEHTVARGSDIFGSFVCQLVINIISGLAGSHKEQLWSSLLRSRKDLRR